jgi:hypothetical protein
MLCFSQLSMDIIKEEPDSDSDCHQISALNSCYFDGVKEERQPLEEIASEAKVVYALSLGFLHA